MVDLTVASSIKILHILLVRVLLLLEPTMAIMEPVGSRSIRVQRSLKTLRIAR